MAIFNSYVKLPEGTSYGPYDVEFLRHRKRFDATWPRNAAASFVIMETVEQAQWIVDNLNGCLENQSCDNQQNLG